jgi:hypothetical protein
MLLRFRAANFRSIHEPIELVLQGRETGDRAEFDALPLAALYGPNGSGKSNVLKALMYMRGAVRVSHQRWDPTEPPPRHPFRLDQGAQDEDSVFEVDFVADGTRFQYGFTVGPEFFTSEWLYSFPEGRRRTLFEREEQKFHFGRGFRGTNRQVADLVRPNSLFVSAGAVNNHDGVRPVFEWFDRLQSAGIHNDAPTSNERTRQLLASDEHSEVRRMLALADLGITDASIRREELPPEVLKAFKAAQAALVEDADDESLPEFPDTREVVDFEHTRSDGYSVNITFLNESRGTQMWFSHIGPVLETLREGGVLVIDELDASLHPRLSSELIRLFANRESNRHGAQLLFSTHDTTLLGNLVDGTLAREDVWFTEKDRDGATTLYPLSDFRPRKSEALERGYLQGRYGAVPIVDLTEVGAAIQ